MSSFSCDSSGVVLLLHGVAKTSYVDSVGAVFVWLAGQSWMFVGGHGSGFVLRHHFSVSLREKFIMVKAYVKKEESSQINDLTLLHLKELEKEQAGLKGRDADSLTWNSSSGVKKGQI